MTTMRTVAELVAAGLVSETDREVLDRVGERYAIAIPPALLALIDKSDPADPIARQFVPSPAELETSPGELRDPIGDNSHSPVEGIVHRYPDRVLLKAVHICPVYCRFCFRREMVGPDGDGSLSDKGLQKALAYIAAHREIWEVILTGGDPLILSNRRLAAIMAALAAIDHVKVVRLHSRVPVATPERVDRALVEILGSSRKTVYVAIHANHPRELSPQVQRACALLADAGIPLLGQTVLLRGVNDDVATLSGLMRRLVELRIRPYYLHHPDMACGTGHFRMSIEGGRQLVARLRGAISGLCQPTYILDIPGGYGKSPIGPTYLEEADEGLGLTMTDFTGHKHSYPPGSSR